jgi:hypothetical protein
MSETRDKDMSRTNDTKILNFIGDPRLKRLGLVLKFPYDWDESDTVLKRMVLLISSHT